MLSIESADYQMLTQSNTKKASGELDRLINVFGNLQISFDSSCSNYFFNGTTGVSFFIPQTLDRDSSAPECPNHAIDARNRKFGKFYIETVSDFFIQLRKNIF